MCLKTDAAKKARNQLSLSLFLEKVLNNDRSESKYRPISFHCLLADLKCAFKISSPVLSNFCASTLVGRRQGEPRLRSFMVFRKSCSRHLDYFSNTGEKKIGTVNVLSLFLQVHIYVDLLIAIYGNQ